MPEADVLTERNLGELFRQVRTATLRLCETLTAEDCTVQSMPDASPTKWHLAHVSWFFETFVLKPHVAGYRAVDPRFEELFNSYYNSVGEAFPRPDRGLLSRPTLDDVLAYREHVDAHMETPLKQLDESPRELRQLIELGCNHEQQHQELILMDVKHMLSRNPLHPAYRADRTLPAEAERGPNPLEWSAHPGGLLEIGHRGPDFAYDNESPRHQVFVRPFEVANRLVTNSEYLQFMEDGGYRRPELWLSDGWDTIRRQGWEAPLYWLRRDDRWREFTLAGLRRLTPAEPVCHVSYFEASAFAEWAGARLPDEAEWEVAATELRIEGNFLEAGFLHPRPVGADRSTGMSQMFGDLWEWTRSAYAPYPGFRPAPGATGEYNGKFMCNQQVLRGGTCVTPRPHMRPTYRNFFYPHCRWQFSGIRLSRDG